MALDIDAKSVAIGGAAVLVATTLFGGKKSTGKSLNGAPKRRKSSAPKAKKAGTTKRKTTKRK